MVNISLPKIILSTGFISATFFAYEAFTRNTVENLDSHKKLIDSDFLNTGKVGTLFC